jgi:hypothetical protein
MANAIPNIPVVNAGALYMSGLVLSNNAVAPTTVVDVSTGAARDSLNVNDIVVSSAVALTITSSGAGGLDTGALANNTLYAVYAIGSSNNQLGNGQPYSAYPGTVIMSLSFTTPVLPFGYDMFRRIGAVRIDTAAVRKFEQVGLGNSRTVWYDVALPTAITAGSSAVYAAVVTTALAPAVNTNIHFLSVFTPTAANNTLNLSYSGVGAVGQAVVSGSVAGVVTTNVLTCPQLVTAGVGGIFYKVTGSATALSVAGYVDQL